MLRCANVGVTRSTGGTRKKWLVVGGGRDACSLDIKEHTLKPSYILSSDSYCVYTPVYFFKNSLLTILSELRNGELDENDNQLLYAFRL